MKKLGIRILIIVSCWNINKTINVSKIYGLKSKIYRFLILKEKI